MSYLERNERALRRLRGEPVAEPELPLRLAFEHGDEHTRLLCPRCGGQDLLLRAIGMKPEIEPDWVSVGLRCTCGVYFRLILERTVDGVLIALEDDR